MNPTGKSNPGTPTYRYIDHYATDHSNKKVTLVL